MTICDTPQPGPDVEREAAKRAAAIYDAIDRTRAKASGRTRFVGQQPYDDEMLLAGLEDNATRAERAEAERDRARLEERERIAQAIEAEADVTPCGEDANVTRGLAKLVRVDFSYDDAEKYEDRNERLQSERDAVLAEIARLRAENAGLREVVRRGQGAVSAAYSQAFAEYQGHDTVADRHDRVVTAWRAEARAALSSEPQAAADGVMGIPMSEQIQQVTSDMVSGKNGGEHLGGVARELETHVAPSALVAGSGQTNDGRSGSVRPYPHDPDRHGYGGDADHCPWCGAMSPNYCPKAQCEWDAGPPCPQAVADGERG